MPSPVFAIHPPFTPELLPVVQMVIEHILSDGGDVFEYGSGFSTPWFAGMANIVSVEHDPGWYGEVMRALDESGLRADVHLVPEQEIPGVIDRHGQFDLVLVDCYEHQRVASVQKAMPHVKPGGWLVLDDSQWPSMAQARKMLSTWPMTIIKGQHSRHTGEYREHQTSLYRRPFDA